MSRTYCLLYVRSNSVERNNGACLCGQPHSTFDWKIWRLNSNSFFFRARAWRRTLKRPRVLGRKVYNRKPRKELKTCDIKMTDAGDGRGWKAGWAGGRRGKAFYSRMCPKHSLSLVKKLIIEIRHLTNENMPLCFHSKWKYYSMRLMLSALFSP